MSKPANGIRSVLDGILSRENQPSRIATSASAIVRQPAAAVQVADHLVRHAGISGGFEIIPPIAADSWLALSGWKILYETGGPESSLARAHIANALQRLPTLLSGLLEESGVHQA